ncbi:ABC transporter ATP-binding protein [bacterium]|nr:MAG: ABC transporter ATP-binding protein [bacterium]
MLRVEHLKKCYDEFVAVKDISFEVRAGEVFGLLGPNGAGKTTTIRMIIHMIKPDTGQIYFKDSLSNGDTTEHIGYLPEERGLYKKSKVRETAVYFAMLKGLTKKTAEQRVDLWLERFELKDFSNNSCEELSKGMQQKVQFIAALVHEPELIILDEPFSGLDPVNQIFFRDIINELAQQGKTVLLSAHQMDHIEKMCERICIVNRGEVVAYDTIESLRNEMDDQQVRITCNSPEKEKLFAAGLLTNIIMTNTGLEGRLNEPQGFPQLLQAVGKIADIQKIEKVRPTLEQIFIRKVKS